MIELDVVNALANGLQAARCNLRARTIFRFAYFCLRWLAMRFQTREYVWRDPGIWLTPTMCARWAGAPVVVQHPKEGLLDAESFARLRSAASQAVRARCRGWGNALTTIVEGAAAMLAAWQADTSPAITLLETIKPIILENGERWLAHAGRRFGRITWQLCREEFGLKKSGVPGVENLEQRGTET